MRKGIGGGRLALCEFSFKHERPDEEQQNFQGEFAIATCIEAPNLGGSAAQIPDILFSGITPRSKSLREAFWFGFRKYMLDAGCVDPARWRLWGSARPRQKADRRPGDPNRRAESRCRSSDSESPRLAAIRVAPPRAEYWSRRGKGSVHGITVLCRDAATPSRHASLRCLGSPSFGGVFAPADARLTGPARRECMEMFSYVIFLAGFALRCGCGARVASGPSGNSRRPRLHCPCSRPSPFFSRGHASGWAAAARCRVCEAVTAGTYLSCAAPCCPPGSSTRRRRSWQRGAASSMASRRA